MAYRDDSRSRVDYYRGRRDDYRRDDYYRRPQSARDRTPSESSYDSYYDDDYRSRYSSRHRPSSYYEPRPRHEESDSNRGSSIINKATLAVAGLSVLAGILQIWTVKKSREQQEAARKELQKDFRSRKEERRRAEAKIDRERQARWAAERARERAEEESEIRSSVRQIEYQSQGGRREKSRVKRLPPPTGWVEGEVTDDGYGSYDEDVGLLRGAGARGKSRGPLKLPPPT